MNHEKRFKEITNRLATIRRIRKVREGLGLSRKEVGRLARTGGDFVRRMESGDPVDVWSPKVYDVASVLGLIITGKETIEPRQT